MNYVDETLDFEHMSIQELQQFYTSRLDNKDIILYGAGCVGKQLKKALELNHYHICCFVDRSADEIGMIEDTPVYFPDKLKEFNHSSACVILCVAAVQFTEECTQKIMEYAPTAVHIQASRNLTQILSKINCKSKMDSGRNLDMFECYQCNSSHNSCEVLSQYLTQNVDPTKKNELKPARKFENLVGFIVGKYCTLKCKNCMEMLPYFNDKDRHFVRVEDIMYGCNKLLDTCTIMPSVALVGGEPMLHPEINRLLSELLNIKKIGYIVVVTNGTVVPDDALCHLLKNERIIIELSNYTDAVSGKLKENILETKRKLEEYGIQFNFSHAKLWLEHTFPKQELSPSSLQTGFSNCVVKDCHVYYDGILYRCQHQYAGVQLGIFDLVEGDYVDVRHLSGDALRDACDQFESVPYIHSCTYCSWVDHPKVVPAAEQL